MAKAPKTPKAPRVRRLEGGPLCRSLSRCSSCNADLWLAPGSDTTEDEALALHVKNNHPEFA